MDIIKVSVFRHVSSAVLAQKTIRPKSILDEKTVLTAECRYKQKIIETVKLSRYEHVMT